MHKQGKKHGSLSLKLVVVFVLLLAVITAGIFIAMRVFLWQIGNTSAVSSARTYSRHYAFIHTGGDDDLWDNIYAGALEKGMELDAYVEYYGEDLTVDYSRNELIDIAIHSAVDGIIIEGDAEPETAEVIGRAAEAGIPTVTVFSDCAESERISFVGFSSYAIGRQVGAELVRHYTGDVLSVSVVMDNAHASSSQDLIASGIADAFSEQGLSDACSVEGLYVNSETPFTAEEDIRDVFLGETLPDAMVALTPVYTRCLFQAAVDYNKVGDVLLFGFHDASDIIEAVGKGLMESTVSVDAGKMGASAVDALDEYLNTGYVSNYISQEARIILPREAAALMKEKAEEDE